jgi:hypothetical protein
LTRFLRLLRLLRFLHSLLVVKDRPVAEIPAIEDEQILHNAQYGLRAWRAFPRRQVGYVSRIQEVQRCALAVDEAQLDLRRVGGMRVFERTDDRTGKAPIVHIGIGCIASVKETEIQSSGQVGVTIPVQR